MYTRANSRVMGQINAAIGSVAPQGQPVPPPPQVVLTGATSLTPPILRTLEPVDQVCVGESGCKQTS